MSTTLGHFRVDRKVVRMPLELAQALQNRPLFIGLDRDGTLVPINADPQKAIVPSEIGTFLSELTSLPDIIVSVVSARSTAQLAADFGPSKVILAGNYGMEIKFPDTGNFFCPVAENSRDSLRKAKEAIESRLPEGLPVILEDHGFSLCLHWHLVAPSECGLVHSAIAHIREVFSDLCFRSLPTSYEVLPTVDWDKSRALDVICQKLGDAADQRLYIFIGDSETDEPAFRWVNERQGLSIRVGASSNTDAMLELGCPSEVFEFIRELVAVRRTPHFRTDSSL